MLIKHQEQLINIARDSIQSGIEDHAPVSIDLQGLDEEIRQLGASFVTLRIDGQLRGCIGSLVAYRPLAIDVLENAYSAAFRDSRFLPLRADEFPLLHYHISVLGEASTMHFQSEQDLLDQLVPHVDGLILKLGDLRATFLPSVWEQLSEKAEFLNHLKSKAGLPFDYWSDDLKIDRYRVESFDH